MRIPLLLLCSILVLPSSTAHAGELPASYKVEFNRDIRPILSDTCYTCHGPASSTRKADLRLDTRDGLFADLGGYHAIVPGKPARSELLKRVTAAQAKRMPPPSSGRQLTPRQIELLRRWVEQGARWQDHWAFIPPTRPPLPAVKAVGWPRNALDHFILDRLEREDLKPAPEADRRTLIRRVTLDLTGLPPTPAEVESFVNDRAPDAYEKLVDRLLASPRYGERMVLEWLDAARYSDTNGYQTDGTRPMWPWRDWVVNALNRNMPFDQFTVEQIAGDLLPSPTIEQKLATGFNRNHMLNGEGGRIAEESRVDYVVDRVETTATIWLGLTAGCGRCHDHKYDPISQKEFYRLYAYFNNVSETGAVDRRNSTAAPVLELPTEEQKAQMAARRNEIARLETELKTFKLPEGWERSLKTERMTAYLVAALRTPPEQRTPAQQKALVDHYLTAAPERQALQKQLEKSRKALDNLQKSVLITMVMEERPTPRDTFVLIRGQYDKYGEKVKPGIPACLPPPKEAPNNRLGLARWLVDRSNPLTARVTVNRFWQTLFGTGLVKTTEDFGSQGEPPSHPELLDWLAVEFRSDWDVKRLHRLIVTSAAYRQSSRVNADLLERDPDNRLLTRGPRGRLSSFALRDQALALSGLLVERRGGPPVRPYHPPGIWEEFSFGFIRYVQDKGESLYRRSLYTFWRRSVAPPNLFDTSPRQVCTVRPSRTNTPLHALVLLNDPTYIEAARVWAERLLRHGGTTEERLTLAFRAATCRPPTAAEKSILLRGFERVLGQYRADPKAAARLITAGEYPRDTTLDPVEVAAYTTMANTILNLDEVLTKE
ncbi:MAG: PSD1 and planctomycete cytochrome C domain-containing protein [Gemmataceae bacterium]|nr:PSD1 and planctomycete cytochrome C domain-containing protein [Gemmataceae bacterium]